MTTTSFNKQNLITFRQEIDKALSEIAAKHGLTSMKISSSISFNANMFTCKLEARTIAKAEDPQEIAKTKFALTMLGLPSDTIGRQFTVNSKQFQVDRVDTKKSKFPVIAKLMENGKVTDKGFKFTVPAVKSYFEKFGG